MPFNLWGKNPQGKPKAYIGHISHWAKPEWEEKAKAEGWTDLKWGSDRETGSSPTTDSDEPSPEQPSAKSPRTRKATGPSTSTGRTRKTVSPAVSKT